MNKTGALKPNESQQKTLLQFWNTNNTSSKLKNDQKIRANNEILIIDDDDNFSKLLNDDDEDIDLITASEIMMAEKSRNSLSSNSTLPSTSNRVNSAHCEADKQEEPLKNIISLGPLASTSNKDTTGYDENSGNVWIYPNNMPIRPYQFNIIQECLHKNTMVILPTGLGKTFIAAVVMLNFYRWYPNGKILFMAPTKPLVNQQSDACCKIVGINKTDMCQMTGQMNPDKRKALWDTKKVFFLTPQVISNDILRGIVDVRLIKCVVIDEAHKALGEYAFCKVIEAINETNKNFRVIALTATPGSDTKTVQGILNSLLISHIELRSDDSKGIQLYNYGRKVDKFIMKLEGEILNIKNIYLEVMKSPLKRLEYNRILTNKDPNSLSKGFVLEKREQFRKNPPGGIDQSKIGIIESDFGIMISLIHALELLCQYGVKSFYMFIKNFIENTDITKSKTQQTKLKNEIMNNDEMAKLYNRFKECFEENAVVPKELRHPKLVKLEELVIEHFKKMDKNNTRVMIFSQYKESVYEITEMLSVHDEIKAMEFVGQSGVNGTHKAVTQKEQLQVVKKFREGGYNTLVSTCVGEEGLDIGEVDLIICYDSQKSPIRLIQRMGRTGRKREGRIIILLTEGKEVSSYECSLNMKNKIYRIIENGAKNFKFYQNNPLMIPEGLKPTCHKIHINVPLSDSDEKETKKERLGKKSLEAKCSKNEEKNSDDSEINNEHKKIVDLKKKMIKNSRKTKAKTQITDNESEKSDIEENVSKNKRQSKKAKSSNIDLGNLSKVTKRKNTKKISKLINLDLEIPSSLSTQLPDIDWSLPQKIVKINDHRIENDNRNNLSDDEDDDLKFLKKSHANLDDILSYSTGSEKVLNSKEIMSFSNSDKLTKIEENQQVNSEISYLKSLDENMIIDETIEKEKSDHSSNQSISPLAIKNSSNKNFKDPIKHDYKMSIQYDPRIIIDDTLPHSYSSMSDTNNTFDRIIEEAIKNINSEDKHITDNKSADDKKDSSFEKFPNNLDKINKGHHDLEHSLCGKTEDIKNVQIFQTLYTNSDLGQNAKNFETNENNESKYNNYQFKDDIYLECKKFDSNTFLGNKRVSLLKNTPNLQKSNSTSTPVRSILKSNPASLNKSQSISYSPMIHSQAVTDQNTKFNKENITIDHSMIRISQALDLLQTTQKPRDISSKFGLNSKLPFKIYFKPPELITFDMGSSLFDLFTLPMDEKLSKANSNLVRFSPVPIKNSMDYESIVCIDDSDLKEITNKKRRLKFDESPKKHNESIVLEEDDDDESLIQTKSKKPKKNFLSESSSFETNDSLSKDINEALGNNYLNKYANDFQSESEEEEEQMDDEENEKDDSEILDNRDIDYKKKKRKKKMKKVAKFIDEEAELSSDDNYEKSEDESDQDDEYDLKDSMIDRNHYDHNESQMAMYHRINLKHNPVVKSYMNRPLPPITADIFSQAVSQGEPSQYILDSFCVSETDEIVYEKKKKKKSKKETKINTKKNLRRLKIMEESAVNSACLSSTEDVEKVNTSKMGNSSYEIFGTNPNDRKRKKKVNMIESLIENNEDEDDLILIEAEANLSRNKKQTKNQNEISIITLNNENSNINVIDDDSDNEDFNNWLSDDTVEKAESSTKNQFATNNFSIFSKPKEKNVSTVNEPIQVLKNSNWILVDTALLASGADIVQNLKKIWSQEKLIIHSNINCDLMISQRCALLRFKWSDISLPANREHVVERINKARSLYAIIIVLIQDDRESNLVKARSKYFDSLLANLTVSSFIMFSRFKTDEICFQVNNLSKTESNLGYGIENNCLSIIETKKKAFNFYLSLPTFSIMNALNACEKYETIAKFLNSSIQDLVSKLKLSDKKAKQLVRFLNLAENS